MNKMYFKEATQLFGIHPSHLLARAEFEMKTLECTMRKVGELYARTVKELWNLQLYQSAIELEHIWYNSPLHGEHKKLKLYIYEIKSSLGLKDRLSKMDIEHAREVPLTKLLGRKGPFKCPYHNEKTPSLFIKHHYFKCFGCGEKGDNIKLIMKTHHLDFKSAVTYILDHE